MTNPLLPEVWLRGPLQDVSALLQPVAHALLQACEEVNSLMINFPEKQLFDKVAGMASPAFHLQHMAGVLDRLFTYAHGHALTAEQLHYLANEGKLDTSITLKELLDLFNQRIDDAIAALKQFDETQLTDFRGVGRKQLPSTVIGLLVHSAEHTMRHTGQLLVTVNVLKGCQ
ncbi:DinB family protein [Mucilaginibacter sp. RS28]|uniref:DinB family protein n=1 Tax=Mucilaginibacter straminoryzae TaxID=2932774 RepID=A0A9X2B841_9SPHI|nr:DinB family protein [Mucilaginibacter straminoryzae]MCJ8209071.1 DinB family protein [Mucilaginibacter straminoryzae]